MDWKTSDIISAVSAAIAIFVFVLGLLSYRSSERWKRSEFVAAQIKDFLADNVNQAVLSMMDYSPARVKLFPDKPTIRDQYVNVQFHLFIKAIADEDFEDDIEFEVRKFFEHFLQSISRLNYFVSSGAIKPKELCADFSYAVGLMTGTLREMKLRNTGVDIAPFSKAVHDYIVRWSCSDIADFMAKITEASKPNSISQSLN